VARQKKPLQRIPDPGVGPVESGADLSSAADRRLRLLSFNIQAGTSTTRYHRYVTDSWRHVLPNVQRVENLDAISKLACDYDFVALQEVDSGSLRSGFINQTRYMATHSGLPFWCHQSNRKVGRFASPGNGFMGRYEPDFVEEHRLPGTIPGRGALLIRFGTGETSLTLAAVHLALGRRARSLQLQFLESKLIGLPHIVIMGDLNTTANSPELKQFCERLELNNPTCDLASYPSWQPQRAIDHILVSAELPVQSVAVLPLTISDHCPVDVQITIPGDIPLSEAGHLVQGVDFTATSG
jgi:endonuclease/exonuclease/phosphatase family metal-dependent hydrolase